MQMQLRKARVAHLGNEGGCAGGDEAVDVASQVDLDDIAVLQGWTTIGWSALDALRGARLRGHGPEQQWCRRPAGRSVRSPS